MLVAIRSLCSRMERGRGILLVSRGHAIRRRGREVRASIFHQPSIAVADGHVEKACSNCGRLFPMCYCCDFAGWLVVDCTSTLRKSRGRCATSCVKPALTAFVWTKRSGARRYRWAR